MKTATLIKRTFLLLLICLFIFIFEWCYRNYSINNDLRDFLDIMLIFVCMSILIPLIIIITTFFIDLADGDYDKWFENNTDPIVKKVQDFFNRRNNGL